MKIVNKKTHITANNQNINECQKLFQYWKQANKLFMKIWILWSDGPNVINDKAFSL